jgi:diguanylate cyclase (GGDEF)-like protein
VTADLLLKKQDDKPYQWVHCLLSKITQENVIVRYEGVIFDITSRLEQEKAIRFQAEYDSLTKVFRRDTAEARLAKFLTESPDTPIVVMLLDLDGFKAINDNFGHDAGDEVLVEIADRFKKNLRGDDVVARLGGDEFFIILYRCEPINAELLLAEKIINAVCQPIQLKSNRSVRVGVSIGMASNYYFKDVDNLIKAADQEMYEVKRNGKNGFALKKNNGEHIIKIFNAGKSIAFFR